MMYSVKQSVSLQSTVYYLQTSQFTSYKNHNVETSRGQGFNEVDNLLTYVSTSFIKI
jgi:hypothetical protein